MAADPIPELVVPYDPGPLLALTARRRRLFRSRLLSLAITVVVMVGIYVWQRDQLRGAGFVAIYALVFGASLAWVVVSGVLYLRTRRQAATQRAGTAIRIGPGGVEVARLSATWVQVASIATAGGGFGRSPVLRLSLTDGRSADLPLDQVMVFPATLDSTARAFSGGRHGVDLSALES